MGGVGNIKSQLYATPFDAQLQITPRRRLFAQAAISVPAGSTGTSISAATGTMPDGIQPGDGVLVDLVFVQASAAASPGITVVSANAFVNGFLGGLLQFTGAPLPEQPLFTSTAITALVNFQALFTPTPPLLSSFDLQALKTFGLGVGLNQALQPLGTQLAFQATVVAANSSAAAIVVTVNVLVFARFVRGLQEG